MVNHYKEDSNRSRVTKQMCHHDPNGALGCLPDTLAFEAGNMRGTLGGILGEWGPLLLDLGDGTPDGSFAGFPLPPALINTGTDVNTGSPVPRDLHKTFAEYDPTYKADETVATLEFSYDFGPMTLTTVAGYQETSFLSQTDYNWTDRGPAVRRPGGAGVRRRHPDQRDRRAALLGSLAGNVRDVGVFSRNYDQSDQEADQWSAEVRLSSEFEGPMNFQVGVFYLDTDDNTNYYVVTSELDYWAQVTAPFTPFLELGAAVLHQCHAERLAEVERGVRRAVLGRDRDDEVDRGPALHARREGREGPADAVLGAGGHVRRPRRRSTSSASTRRPSTSSPAASASTVKPGWFDDSTLYAFYSRGYKAGGFNPPLDRSLPQFAGTPEVYDPEFVNALRGRLEERARRRPRAGEPDRVLLPVRRVAGVEDRRAHVGQRERRREHLRAGRRVRVQPGERPADRRELRVPQDQDQGLQPASIRATRATAIRTGPSSRTSATARTACWRPLRFRLRGRFGLVLPASGRRSVRLLRRRRRTPGLPVQDGIAADLDGNSLQGTPEWSFKVGAQYTFHLGSTMNLTTRADYYWRDSFYARIFNRPIDKIDAWDVVNAQVELGSASNSWFVRGYVYNLMDDDNITGMYVTDASSGLFTNVFALDPRTYGLVLGFRF